MILNRWNVLESQLQKITRLVLFRVLRPQLSISVIWYFLFTLPKSSKCISVIGVFNRELGAGYAQTEVVLSTCCNVKVFIVVYGTHFQTVCWKRSIVLHSVLHRKSDRDSCVKNGKRELEREVQTSALLANHGREVSVNVRLSVSERYRNDPT